MPSYYYSSTAGSYTLTGDVNASATILVLGSVTGLPTSTPYKVVLEPGQPGEEIVKVMAVAGASLTVLRGWDGTSAGSHGAGSTVRHMVTAEDFTLSRTHEDATAAHGATGAVVGTTNPQVISNKDFTNGTNTFPSNLVTTSGSQQLSNKTLIASGVNAPGAIVKGIANQVANILEVRDSTGAVLASVGPNYFQSAGLVANYGDAVAVVSQGADKRAIVVRGANGQTANLQEWTDSGTNLLAAIDKSGNITAANLSDTGVQGAGITAAAGWSIDIQSLRIVNHVAQVYIRFTRTGAAIPANSAGGGDIANTLVGTVPIGYIPSIPASGSSGLFGPMVGVHIYTDGGISLTAGPSNIDISTGLVLSASFTYLV